MQTAMAVPPVVTMRSYPLLFHEVILQSADEDPDGPRWPVNNAAILHGSLAFPTD